MHVYIPFESQSVKQTTDVNHMPISIVGFPLFSNNLINNSVKPINSVINIPNLAPVR